MRLLVDTHVLIWSAARPETIPKRVVQALTDADAVFASAVSAYEIDFKRRLHPSLTSMPADIAAMLAVQNFRWLSINAVHAKAAALLPLLHRDPWDRILIAQAQVEGLTLVTRDAQIARYDVPILW